MDGGSLCMMSLPVWLPGPMFLPGVFVPGLMFFLGVSDQRGLCPGGLYRETPQSEKRVVDILLECFLVFISIASFLSGVPFALLSVQVFFFHFHAVFGKAMPNNWLMPFGVDTYSEKTWIRHCKSRIPWCQTKIADFTTIYQ